MADEISDLRTALAALEARVADLERTSPPAPASSTDPDVFWALAGLRERIASDPGRAPGAVMLVGSVALPDGAAEWQQGASSAGLLETDWSDSASALSALAHPVRLELTRHILNGTHATAELAALEGLGTTGQLHHHLRQLVSAGWVRQSGRGSYEVPAARVVPVLAVVMAAQR
ncbi:helix-turn-helix domain-containing protein [Ruania suaedae]|uniref:ArsR/SmtB family transcription factor n=1 Tax=Ruania suaedae TaxID=2897774 RepID=UPI001E460B79|nr:helix-turn-helix domain-containing protein [Ruania suaedae]UFU02308.1 helix-turn-helix domain-containing protein [Ruania suaedae]